MKTRTSCRTCPVSPRRGGRRIAPELAIRGFMDEQVVIRVDGARQNFNQVHRGRFFLDPDLVEGEAPSELVERPGPLQERQPGRSPLMQKVFSQPHDHVIQEEAHL